MFSKFIDSLNYKALKKIGVNKLDCVNSVYKEHLFIQKIIFSKISSTIFNVEIRVIQQMHKVI